MYKSNSEVSSLVLSSKLKIGRLCSEKTFKHSRNTAELTLVSNKHKELLKVSITRLQMFVSLVSLFISVFISSKFLSTYIKFAIN